MLNHSFFPLAVAYSYQKGQSTFFVAHKSLIEIQNCNEILSDMLPRCDGSITLDQLKTNFLTTHDGGDIETLLSTLISNQIIVDGFGAYRRFHPFSCNPMQFCYSISPDQMQDLFENDQQPYREVLDRLGITKPNSPFFDLVRQRQSTRSFANQSLTLEQINGLVLSTLSRSEEGNWTAPSGGGLYPVRQYIAVPPNQGIGAGIYFIDPISWEYVILAEGDFRTQLATTFIDNDELLENAGLVQILTVDFNRTASKYANRGYRYGILEAGHAAQNAYLYCAENNLGIVEIGGFYDSSLGAFLGLDPDKELPITTLITGAKYE